ncbi:MAG: exonuclease [Candidatus Electrothrix sp. AR4]|nr:exonuclease [Candidatus Electrothrix sp. AR4]
MTHYKEFEPPPILPLPAPMLTDFIVIDTEGRHTLTEIAILDARGVLLFEGFTEENEVRHDVYPTTELLRQLTDFSEDKKIVCHYAKHDENLLRKSFAAANLDWPNFQFICTYESAKSCFPNLSSYSLEHLSKSLQLQVEKRYFNPQAAHGAYYDALFTLQLYRKMQQKMHNKNTGNNTTANNPFSNTRVDSPFQQHVDLDSVHYDSFLRITKLIDEIKTDTNQQSRGAVVLGQAGNGKTHLMMRLAQHTLENNRLFFIRQPNHEKAVFYHIYSRMLESFIETIPNTEYSQLEYLLGRSFSKIVIKALKARSKPSKKDLKILHGLSQRQLNIYTVLGREGSETKRRNWDYIERQTLQWWQKTYGISDYACNIITGLIRFCRYSDSNKKELVRRWLAGQHLLESELQAVRLKNWEEELSREDFALQAMVVFGRLSVVDEPLIIVFDQLEGLKYNQGLLLRFGEAIKELFTHVPNCLMLFNLFPDRWRYFEQRFDASVTERMGQYLIILELPDKAVLAKMLALKLASVDLNTDTLFDPDELDIILGHRSIRSVLNCAADYYRYKLEGVPLPRYTLSFETRVDQALHDLQQEILELRQHLNMDGKINKVSPLDPVPQEIISYIEHKQEQLTADYSKKTIISDTDDLGKLLLILNALEPLYTFKLEYLRLGKRKLPEHVVIHSQKKKAAVAFSHADAHSFAPRIKNFNQLVVTHKDILFALFRDDREPKIKSNVAKGEIEKLNCTENGKFVRMDRPKRIHFELVHQIISDIQNHDLHAELDRVMPLLWEMTGKEFWLFRAIAT